MKMSRRAKYRIAIVVWVSIIMLLLGSGAFIGRAFYRNHRITVAYEEARTAYAEGRYSDALAGYSVYVGRHPDEVDTLVIFAEIRRRVPSPDLSHLRFAVRLYTHALDLDPDNLPALENLLEIYQTIGKRIELSDTADIILSFDPVHEAALKARIYSDLAVGAVETATRFAERLCESDPDRFEYHELFLHVRLRAGDDPQQLVQYCDRLVGSDPDQDGRWLLLRSNIHLRNRDLERVRADLLAAAERGVDRLLFEGLIWDLELIGERDEVGKLVVRAEQEYGQEVWPYLLAARRGWVYGRLENVATAIERGLERVSSSDRVMLICWQGLLASVNGQTSEAKQSLRDMETILSEVETDQQEHVLAWADAIRARLNFSKGQWIDVSKDYQNALLRMTVSPEGSTVRIDRAVVHYLYGQALMALGEQDQAIEQYRQAFIDSQRRWVLAGTAQADAERRAGHLRNALDTALDLVSRTNPTFSQPWIVLGECWLALEQTGLVAGSLGQRIPWPDAMTFLNALNQGLPEGNEVVLPLLARAYLQQQDTANLRDILDEAASRESLAPPIARNLAQLALGIDENDLARRLLEKAQSEKPADVLEDAAIRATMMARNGQVEAGLNQLLAVRDQQTEVDVERWRLQCLYFCLTHDLAATEQHLQALIDDPDLTLGTAIFLLSLDVTWSDRDQSDRLVEYLRNQLPPSSSQLLLAEAKAVLRYHHDDKERIADMVTRLDRIRKWNRESVALLTTLADLYLAGPEPSERLAIQQLREAVDHFPQMVSLYPRLIALLQKHGDFSSASRLLNQMRQHRQPGSQLTRTASLLLARQGEFATAAERLGTSFDSNTASEIDRLLLASWLWRAGRAAEARNTLDELLQHPRPSPLVIEFAARFFDAQGETPRAMDLLNSSPLDDERLRPVLLGAFHMQRGDREEAKVELTRAVELNPENVTALLWRGRLHMGEGEPERALELAQRGLSIDPDHADLNLLMAACSLATSPENRDASLAKLREVLGDNRAVIDTIDFFAQLDHRDGQFEVNSRHLQSVRELVETYPTFLPLVRLAVTLHVQAGRTNQAVDLVETAIVRMPGEADVAMWLTQLHIELGRLDDAWLAAILWRQRSLDDPLPASRALASIALDQRRPSKAYELLAPLEERIVSLSDRQPQLLELWVVTLLMNDRVEEAFDLQRTAIATTDAAYARWLKISSILDAEITMQALANVVEYALASPRALDLACAWAELGSRLLQDNSPRAAECFAKAESIVGAHVDGNQDAVSVDVCRGILAAAAHDYERARTLYEAVLQQEPLQPVAMNNIAMLLSQRLNQPERAAFYSSQLVERYPEYPQFRDTHAQVLLQVGRLDEADEIIKGILTVEPDRLASLVTQGRIQIARGDLIGADESLNRATVIMRKSLVRSPESEEAIEAARRQLLSDS